MLYIEEVEKQNPRSLIKIQHNGSGFTMIGIIEDNLDFQLANNYDSNDMSSGGMDAGINMAANALDMSSFTATTLLGTVSAWKGSNKPSFSVSFTLTQYSPKKGTDIFKKVKTLMSLLAPGTSSISDISSGGGDITGKIGEAIQNKVPGLSNFLTPPGGYQFDILHSASDSSGLKNFKGTWIMEYSNWFRCDTLTLDSASFSFSKEVARTTGLPVSAKIGLSFTPAVQPTADEVASWLKGI